MNEEIVLEAEIDTVPTAESTSTPDETEASEAVYGPVTSQSEPVESEVLETSYEDFQYETIPETTELITVEVIQSVGTDIVCSNLFGSFLLCGTLIGLALLRKIYGT